MWKKIFRLLIVLIMVFTLNMIAFADQGGGVIIGGGGERPRPPIGGFSISIEIDSSFELE